MEPDTYVSMDRDGEYAPPAFVQDEFDRPQGQRYVGGESQSDQPKNMLYILIAVFVVPIFLPSIFKIVLWIGGGIAFQFQSDKRLKQIAYGLIVIGVLYTIFFAIFGIFFSMFVLVMVILLIILLIVSIILCTR